MRLDSLELSATLSLSERILIVSSLSLMADSREVILTLARESSLSRYSILTGSGVAEAGGARDLLAGGGLTVLGIVPVRAPG